MRPIIYIFPGQASQYVGMGRNFYDNSPASREFLDRAKTLEGFDHLPDIIWNGPDTLLTRTDNVQPAITIVSLMALSAINEALSAANVKIIVCAAAGHSLGEYAAHVAAGNLAGELALRLVWWRGKWMNEYSQSPNPKGGMVAVMGADPAHLETIVGEIGTELIAIANLNSPGQIILSGEANAVSLATEKAQAAGAKRCIPLNVSGAWHSPLMKPAQERMELLLSQEITPDRISINPRTPVVANATANIVGSVDELRDSLTRQITSPVRWMESVYRLVDIAGKENNPLFVEVGPGKVLKGLLKNIDRELEVINVEDMAGVQELISKISN